MKSEMLEFVLGESSCTRIQTYEEVKHPLDVDYEGRQSHCEVEKS